jgi:putative membrane protein
MWWVEKTVKFLITPVVLLIAAALIPGVGVSSFYIAIVIAIVLGFMNIFIRPILILLSLPITILTFGLFIFVLNGAMLWLISTFVKGFYFSGFLPAFVTALLISIAGWLGDRILD